MKIGILGSGEVGDVGRRLGDGLIESGHQVKIGTRDLGKEQIVQWANKHSKEEQSASVGSFTEAASFGEIVFVATIWNGACNAIKMANLLRILKVKS
jgi:predicted dinucleotide-binding enzyme